MPDAVFGRYVSLGRVLCAHPPPKEDLLAVLNDVWAELGASKSPRIYVDVAGQVSTACHLSLAPA